MSDTNITVNKTEHIQECQMCQSFVHTALILEIKDGQYLTSYITICTDCIQKANTIIEED